MPLSDFDKHTVLLAQRNAELDWRTRRKMEKAAFKYLNQDIAKSRPSYGVRTHLLFFLFVLFAIVLLTAALFFIFPYKTALTVCVVSLLALTGVCIMVYRTTGHLTQDAFLESIRIWGNHLVQILNPQGNIPNINADEAKAEITSSTTTPVLPAKAEWAEEVPKVDFKP